MSRRMSQNMQIPRYPNGCIGWTWNIWQRPLMTRRLNQVVARAKNAEAKLLRLAATKI